MAGCTDREFLFLKTHTLTIYPVRRLTPIRSRQAIYRSRSEQAQLSQAWESRYKFFYYYPLTIYNRVAGPLVTETRPRPSHSATVPTTAPHGSRSQQCKPGGHLIQTRYGLPRSHSLTVSQPESQTDNVRVRSHLFRHGESVYSDGFMEVFQSSPGGVTNLTVDSVTATDVRSTPFHRILIFPR